jgi:hypothetical protein
MAAKKASQHQRLRRKQRRLPVAKRAEVSILERPSLAHAPEPKERVERPLIEVECGPVSTEAIGPWRSIARLKKRFRVSRAVDLHPSLNFADEGESWPSPGWGVVTPDVLERLQRARAILIAIGFRVDADPLNELGDGKSWTLLCELTDNVPNVVGLPDLVQNSLQSGRLPVATKPFWDGGRLLVDLWHSQRMSLQPTGLELREVNKSIAEKLKFRRLPNGRISADEPFSPAAVLNTRNELVQIFKDLRNVVRTAAHKGEKPAPADVAKMFKGTAVARVAGLERWAEWIGEFTSGLTAKNATLVFLEEATGRKRTTLESMLSRARKSEQRGRATTSK